MTHDEMMSLLANTLADAAGHAGCLPILDCFSPHPGEEVTVSIPMCDDTVDIVLEDNVGSIFDVSMTYGNKPYPIPEIKPEQMDKAIKELERLSPVNIIFQNEGVVGYDAEQHAIVFPTAMPQREVLARLPAEIVIATAEQHTPGISQAPYLRKTAMAVSVEFCGRFSLPMPDTAAATLDGMDTHIPPGEERKTLEEIRELSVTIGDTVEKALGLQRGQSAPQRDEAR